MHRKVCECLASILHQRYWSRSNLWFVTLSHLNCLKQHRSHGPIIFIKFGHKTAYDISQDPFWSILTYVNFWRLHGCSSSFGKIGCLHWFGQESVNRCALECSTYPGLDFWISHWLAICWAKNCQFLRIFELSKSCQIFLTLNFGILSHKLA